MKRKAMESMPEGMPQAIHNVLRNWHGGRHNHSLWNEMLIVAQQIDKQPVPDPGLAVKEILLEALDALDEQAGSDVTQILRLHFLDGLIVSEIATRLNFSDNVVYKQQRATIEELAGVVWQAERDARSARMTRIASRLEIQEPPRLFGVKEKLLELMTVLTAADSPWLIAVTGIGGIGKTSLADVAVREVAHTPTFADVAWVSARQNRFTLWGGLVEGSEDHPALTFEGLLDVIIEQLGFQDLAASPLAQKQVGMSALFKAQPYLVVVDNLETAVDYRALVPCLESMVNPSKLLLTSRHSLHEYSGVYNLRLDELSAKDSLALLRHEAEKRGLANVVATPDKTLQQIYEVAGGNPLALKLLVGQMYTLPLSQVVDDLYQAQGRTVEELYRFIYWRSWHLLTERAQQVLTIMPLVAEEGGGLKHISTLSNLDGDQLTSALRQLVTLSLVNVWGIVETRRYSIHRLTETFLRNEVLKWKPMN